MITSEKLRCGTKVRTKNGWFNIIGVWVKDGKTYKVDLSANGREIPSIDAKELCKHILEVDVI